MITQVKFNYKLLLLWLFVFKCQNDHNLFLFKRICLNHDYLLLVVTNCASTDVSINLFHCTHLTYYTRGFSHTVWLLLFFFSTLAVNVVEVRGNVQSYVSGFSNHSYSNRYYCLQMEENACTHAHIPDER